MGQQLDYGFDIHKDAEDLCNHIRSSNDWYIYDSSDHVNIVHNLEGCDDLYTIGSNGVVRTCCNSGILTKDCVIELIKTLFMMLDSYDDNFKQEVAKDCLQLIKRRVERRTCKKDLSNQKKHISTSGPSIGYIYVIKELGFYKIGKTKDINSRMGEYTKLPEEPEIIIVEKVYDYSNCELELHDMYKKKRKRKGKCEWFELDKYDLKNIKLYLRQHIVIENDDKETDKQEENITGNFNW